MALQLAELAIHIPAVISLFEKYEFNYYQNGTQTLREACCEKELDFSRIDSELNSIQKDKQYDGLLTLEGMDINGLIDFVNGQHHHEEAEVLLFIHKAIWELIALSSDGASDPEKLIEVEEKFGVFKEKLIRHCEREDKELFPQLRKIVELRREKFHVFSKAVSDLKLLVSALEKEHAHTIQIFSTIKTDLDRFNVPVNASPKYMYLMHSLKKFEFDFHIHLHIENNILFPKIRTLEEQLKEKQNNAFANG